MPDRFLDFQKSWQREHPDWEYQLWTDADNLRLIETEFPWFLPTYLAYPHTIQRVDAARYFIVLHHGGLYVDLDFECLRPLNELINGHSCVFGLEPTATAHLFSRQKTVGNALIAATPNHPMLHVLTRMLEPYFRQVDPMHEQVILETTGPFMLTNVYDGLPNQELVKLIDSEHLYPVTMQEADVLRGFPQREDEPRVDVDAARRRLKNAFAVHHHYGTWWRGG